MKYIIDYRRQFAPLCDGVHMKHLDNVMELPTDATMILCHWNNRNFGANPSRCKARSLLLEGLAESVITYPVVFFAGDCSSPLTHIDVGDLAIPKFSRDELARQFAQIVSGWPHLHELGKNRPPVGP